MAAVDWTLDDDLNTVTIRFPSKPPVVLRYDATQVEEVLSNLGEFRARMTPEVPRNMRPGQKVSAIQDPEWYTQPEMLQGDVLLHIRDPRFGWMNYLLPRESAAKLGEYLTNLSRNAPPEPPHTGVN